MKSGFTNSNYGNDKLLAVIEFAKTRRKTALYLSNSITVHIHIQSHTNIYTYIQAKFQYRFLDLSSLTFIIILSLLHIISLSPDLI